jgi:hypothetical protein
MVATAIGVAASPSADAQTDCQGQPITNYVTGEALVGLGNARNVVQGDGAANSVDLGGGNDVFCGGGGLDRAWGRSGRDYMSGNDGNDRMAGNGDKDVLRGGRGRDRLYGGGGADRLFGDQGGDRLYGGGGDDVIYGGPGNDIADGGSGYDRCYDVEDHTGCEEVDGVVVGGAEVTGQILITNEKWRDDPNDPDDATDGWVLYDDDTINWVSPACRPQLTAAGMQLVEVPWSDIAAKTDGPARSCAEILALTPDDLGDAAANNLALIRSNPARETLFDNESIRNTPMDQIDLFGSGLAVSGDLYNEGLLDTSHSGYFRVKCEYSHFAYDDPIIYPNQPGRAHLHMFFGNTNANAYSTYDTLANSGNGTCNGFELNRTAYWIPAVLDQNGDALIPGEIMVYYKNDNYRLPGYNELVEPFPDNLRMIAGNAGATTPQTERTGPNPWNLPIVSFNCGPSYGNNPVVFTIPDCVGSQFDYRHALEMKIAFRQCFDPDSGTYLSDQSHTSYSVGGYYGAACPASHPQDMSSIMYRIFFYTHRFPHLNYDLGDLVLSSDVKHDQILPGGTTLHGDWFGAWHPEAMDRWVENCNNTQADCEIGLLGRDPFVSLLPRHRRTWDDGWVIDAEDLVQLCPGKQFDSSDPVRSVALCRHS